MSVDAARKLANFVLADVAHGKDPQSDISAKRMEMSVADLCDLYLEEGVDTKKSSTIATDTGRIERHIKPLLGRKLVSEVESVDIQKFMRDIAAGKTAADVKTKSHGRAIVTGGKGTAARTVGLLGGIFTYAVKRRIVGANPVRGVERYPDRMGERFLSEHELTKLGTALTDLESEGVNSAAIAIIRLLTFTGARKSEITRLTWDEVDFNLSCLRLKDSKTGSKMIPLGPAAILTLKKLKKESSNGFVFPAEFGNRAYQGTEKIWKRVREQAKLPDLRIHDLRHSFASVALASGDSLFLIGKLLGHRDVKTTARYAHLADHPLRSAATRISNTIATAMNKKQEK